MKKQSIALLAVLLSSLSFAADTQREDKKENTSEPTIYLSVFDDSQSPSPDMNTKEISRSNKTQKLCWVVTGKFGKKVNISETFKAQAKSEFTRKGAKVVSSPDKKQHTLNYSLETVDNGKYVVCWKFGDIDPIGEYVLTLKINNHKFEKQIFHVTE